MADLKIYNGTSWVKATAKTYNGSSWEDKMKFHDGSAWVELYGPRVSPSTTNVFNSANNTFCKAGVRYLETGVEFQSNNVGNFNLSRGNWLDSGTSDEVWIQRVINSGTLTEDGGSGRLQLSTGRTFSVTQIDVGAKVCDLTFNFYDAASGGILIGSANVILAAEHAFDPGPNI